MAATTTSTACSSTDPRPQAHDHADDASSTSTWATRTSERRRKPIQLRPSTPMATASTTAAATTEPQQAATQRTPEEEEILAVASRLTQLMRRYLDRRHDDEAQ